MCVFLDVERSVSPGTTVYRLSRWMVHHGGTAPQPRHRDLLTCCLIPRAPVITPSQLLRASLDVSAPPQQGPNELPEVLPGPCSRLPWRLGTALPLPSLQVLWSSSPLPLKLPLPFCPVVPRKAADRRGSRPRKEKAGSLWSGFLSFRLGHCKMARLLPPLPIQRPTPQGQTVIDFCSRSRFQSRPLDFLLKCEYLNTGNSGRPVAAF